MGQQRRKVGDFSKIEMSVLLLSNKICIEVQEAQLIVCDIFWQIILIFDFDIRSPRMIHPDLAKPVPFDTAHTSWGDGVDMGYGWGSRRSWRIDPLAT
jgi:hypothetical protein